jgi:ATP-dependent Clp protease ATP-binding subunit ClpC
MFDRYTEHARRALFYTRYEASQVGGESLESEHLLLGLIKRPEGLIHAIFDRAHLPLARIYEDIARRSAARPRLTTSVEIPFGDDVKQSLMLAEEEAGLLGDEHIGCEHLLLGLLRHDTCVASSILAGHGLTVDAVRRDIVSIRRESAGREPEGQADLRLLASLVAVADAQAVVFGVVDRHGDHVNAAGRERVLERGNEFSRGSDLPAVRAVGAGV